MSYQVEVGQMKVISPGVGSSEDINLFDEHCKTFLSIFSTFLYASDSQFFSLFKTFLAHAYFCGYSIHKNWESEAYKKVLKMDRKGLQGIIKLTLKKIEDITSGYISPGDILR